MFCKNCGAQLNENANFCDHCGCPVKENTQQGAQYTPFNNGNYSQKQKGIIQEVREKNKQKQGKKKTKYGCLIVFVVLFVAIIFLALIGNAIDSDDNVVSTSSVSETTTDADVLDTEETSAVEKNSTTSPETDRSSIIEQFQNIGLNKSESEKFADTFIELGFGQIRDIEFVMGDDSADGLQAYRCRLYDYETLQINFTIENRTLCYVELAGLPTEKSEHYISMFGNLKTKRVQTTTSVTMYDITDDEGNIDYSKNGYLAVFDYENKKISEYEG